MPIDIIKVRRDLHQIPEVGWQEFKTAQYYRTIIELIVKESGRKDLEIKTLETGTVVYVPGLKKTPNYEGQTKRKTIGWRTDIDALPIAEETGLAFQSKHDGFMHACGHDVHMSVALKTLEKIVLGNFYNNHLFLFQPAEESIGGAKRMWEEVIKPNYQMDQFYALHDSPEFPEFSIATKTGTLYAGAIGLQIKFQGKSGHGAMPHMTVDTITMAANFITTAQTLISRNLDPTEGNVFSIGKIHGGQVFNQIAGEVDLDGHIRISNPKQEKYVIKRINEIAKSVAKAFGGEAQVEIIDMISAGYPPLVNDTEVTNNFVSFLKESKLFNYVESPLTMVSEDYAYIAMQVPSMMFQLGVGGKDQGLSLHSSKFPSSEAVIEPCAEFLSQFFQTL